MDPDNYGFFNNEFEDGLEDEPEIDNSFTQNIENT